MSKVTIGCCCDLIPPAPLGLYKGWHDAGARVVRYMPWSTNINPAPDVWDWSKADHDMQVFADVGLKVLFDPMWYPAHWIEPGAEPWEQKWGLPYDAGWWKVENGIPVWDHKYDGIEPNKIITARLTEFEQRCAERYKGRVWRWSTGPVNEPGIEGYFAPSTWMDRLDESDPLVRLGPNVPRLVEEVAIPGMAGVIKEYRHALFAGPNADSPGFVPEWSALLKRTPLRAVSQIARTFHGYPENDAPNLLASATKRLGEFTRAFADNANDEPLMNTEMGFGREGGNPNIWNGYFAACEVSGVSHVFIYDFTIPFKAGTIEQNTGWQKRDGLLKNGATSYELSTAGEFLCAYTERGRGKHRAVTSGEKP